MRYWLMKSEPSAFSIEDLVSRPHQTEPWDGVRNYQARNMLRDEMKPGDLAFFYHSNCTPPGIVGTIEIVCSGYPDTTAFDPQSPYFDSKSTSDNPRWYRVDVRFLKKFSQMITLNTLKNMPQLQSLVLLRPGNRLSVMPVTAAEWQAILKLGSHT